MPFVTLDEAVSPHRLTSLLAETLATAILPANGHCRLPLLAFFVCADLPATLMPALPIAPDRLFLLAGDPAASAAVMAALAVVERHEPNRGRFNLGRLDFGDQTPLREIFRQMAAVPITAISVTTGPGGGTLFFLRTPFTIRSLFAELAVMLYPPS